MMSRVMRRFGAAPFRFEVRSSARLRRYGFGWLLGLALCVPNARALASQSELAAKLIDMQGQLEGSVFKHRVVLQSSETADGLRGDVFAIVEHPVQSVGTAFSAPHHWCEAMLLHLNNRACSISNSSGTDTITLSVVRKYDQPVTGAFRIPFDFHVADSTAQHFEATLFSKSGPLGTSNYRISIEAIPVSAQRSFVHFSYAYEEGFMARAGTQAYLSLFGSAKIGFTVVGKNADGSPSYIKGTRGLMERNAMRYFLAIDTYLATTSSDAQARWTAWFNASEQYPQQLHELDLPTYLAIKQADAHH